MYDDILLPFDGSDGAGAVLHHAGEIAHWSDATIHVLYVADTRRSSVTVVEGNSIDTLVRQGEEVVKEAEKTLQTLGVDHDTDVVQGKPAPTIVEYAETYDHDVIVMPTHGRDGVSRHLVGSMTEKVIQLSSVPVLTARIGLDEQLVFPYENVLIPTDGSAVATNAAQHGLSLAASLDATAYVLSVVNDAPLGLDIRSTVLARDTEERATEAVEEIKSSAAATGVEEIVTLIDHGSPVEEIRNCIRSANIHVVVLGTTGRQGADRVLSGSVAEKTVRSASVPVVTIANPR